MHFLPIVQRELLVTARRKSAHGIRCGAALIGMLLVGGLMFVSPLGSSGRSAGTVVFQVVAWYSFFLCMVAGIFVTSDCLSEENREGTLGLLFLTDLKGYDIVLGKFAAMSLNAFYALLALFPVMAAPLLLGGVTVGEFWRMTFALVNALFFSASLCIWISAREREQVKILCVALGCLVLFGLVLPAVGLSPLAGALGWMAYLSPTWPFLSSFASSGLNSQADYGVGLFLSFLTGCAFLFLGSW